MSEWIEALELELEHRKMKPADLSRATGISEGTISRWRKGESKPSPLYRRTVERALGWNVGSRIRDPDDELNRALFSHPGLEPGEAEFVWKCVTLMVKEKRGKGRGGLAKDGGVAGSFS